MCCLYALYRFLDIGNLYFPSIFLPFSIFIPRWRFFFLRPAYSTLSVVVLTRPLFLPKKELFSVSISETSGLHDPKVNELVWPSPEQRLLKADDMMENSVGDWCTMKIEGQKRISERACPKYMSGGGFLPPISSSTHRLIVPSWHSNDRFSSLWDISSSLLSLFLSHIRMTAFSPAWLKRTQTFISNGKIMSPTPATNRCFS